MAQRVRACAEKLGFTANSLSRAVEVSSSAGAEYWHGRRPWPTEVLASLADTLKTDVDYLLRGRTGRHALTDAADVDWVTVPTYDLNAFDDDGKGEALSTTIVRRDWLYRELRVTSGLWMTDMPSDYPSLGLARGDGIFCEDVTVADLSERLLCIWREVSTGRFLVGRYSIVWSPSIHVDAGGEYWMNRLSLGGDGGPPSLVPIAHVLGRPVAGLR